MANSPDSLVDSGDIIAVDTEGGRVRIKIGDAVRGSAVYQDVSIFSSGAFISVPSPPGGSEAAQALYVRDGHEVNAIGWRDNRADIVEKVGGLASGDAFIVSQESEARLLLKAALDLIALYSKNATTGHSMMCALDGDAGEITISNGDAFFKMKPDEIVIGINGGSVLRLAKNSLNLQGNGEWKGMVKIGMNCPPGPILPVNGCAYGVAGPVNTVSTSVCISP